MSIKGRILDGEGTGREAGVTARKSLKVSVIEMPPGDIPIDELTARKQYREFFALGGSTDLNVDGSSSDHKFTITSSPDVVKWVKAVRFLFNDTSMELDTNDFRRFGTAAIEPGLTNGIELYVMQGGTRTDLFLEPIKTIGDFMNYIDRYTNFINSVGSQEDFLMFELWLEEQVVLPSGSGDSVIINIRDDLTPVDLFRAIARGSQEII